MSAKIIAVANQKGGVGKTTTVVNLAASLASKGQRVLIVDLDPQGNATTGSGINKGSIHSGVYQVLLGEADVREAISRSEAGQYDVLAANRALAGAEIELVQEIAREMRLKNALADVLDDYDFILLDCPPTLTLLTLNGLVAAEGVLVPMVCEYYALEGISDLVATARKIRHAINPRLDIIGIVRTLYSCKAISAASFSPPPSRATCAWPKRPATACPRWPMMPKPKARWLIWRWPMNCWHAQVEAFLLKGRLKKCHTHSKK